MTANFMLTDFNMPSTGSTRHSVLLRTGEAVLFPDDRNVIPVDTQYEVLGTMK